MNNSLRRIAAGLLLSWVILPGWAQEASEEAVVPELPSASAPASTDAESAKSASFRLQFGGDEDDAGAASKARGITITVDADDEESSPADREVERVIGKLEAALGRLPESIRSELDDEDMSELRAAIRDIEGLKQGRTVVHKAESGFDSEIIPAVLAIVLLFGGPVLIVTIISFNNRRKRQLVHQTIDKIIEQGRDVPVELLDALDKGKNGKSALARGTVNIAIGVAVCVWLYLVSGIDVASIGLIPLCIGIAQIVVWKIEKPNVGSSAVA